MEAEFRFSGNGRDLNSLEIGRLPQFFCKWKTTSIFKEFLGQHQYEEMKDTLRFSGISN